MNALTLCKKWSGPCLVHPAFFVFKCNGYLCSALRREGCFVQLEFWRFRMAVTFLALALHHPSIQHANSGPPDHQPCKDKHGAIGFENQCAIRLGVAITGAGQPLSGYQGAFCWHGHGRAHPLRVEQMIKWLNSVHVTFVGQGELTKRPKNGAIDPILFSRRHGIIACRNFHGRGNQGDHIDLWSGTTMAHGSADYISRSEEVWFWPMP